MMVKYKNIRIKKKGGGTRLQRVMVLASGKYKFVKNLTKSRSTRTKTTRKKTKRRKTNLVRRKRGGRRGNSLVQTAYKLIPTIALVAPYAGIAISSHSGKTKLAMGVRAATGYSLPNMGLGTTGWSLSRAAEGWMPFIGSILIVKGAQKLRGIIRSI